MSAVAAASNAPTAAAAGGAAPNGSAGAAGAPPMPRAIQTDFEALHADLVLTKAADAQQESSHYAKGGPMAAAIAAALPITAPGKSMPIGIPTNSASQNRVCSDFNAVSTDSKKIGVPMSPLSGSSSPLYRRRRSNADQPGASPRHSAGLGLASPRGSASGAFGFGVGTPKGDSPLLHMGALSIGAAAKPAAAPASNGSVVSGGSDSPTHDGAANGNGNGNGSGVATAQTSLRLLKAAAGTTPSGAASAVPKPAAAAVAAVNSPTAADSPRVPATPAGSLAPQPHAVLTGAASGAAGGAGTAAAKH